MVRPLFPFDSLALWLGLFWVFAQIVLVLDPGLRCLLFPWISRLRPSPLSGEPHLL